MNLSDPIVNVLGTKIDIRDRKILTAEERLKLAGYDMNPIDTMKFVAHVKAEIKRLTRLLNEGVARQEKASFLFMSDLGELVATLEHAIRLVPPEKS